MTWIGECVIAFGTLALGLMVILGITSLPSVGSRMNWRQWTFVQSYLGHLCLFLAAVHLAFNACPSWGTTPIQKTVQKLSFLSFLLPVLALFLRLVLVLPCFSIFLYKIRRGWECCLKTEDIEASKSTSMQTSHSKYSPSPSRKMMTFDNVGFSQEDSINRVQTI